jgi:branched-chain amino acid transport system permease protein
MSEFITYTIVGLVTAAVYAIAASGLVVTYTTSGVFNVAHGAVGMFAAFVYWQLRWDWGWPTPVALIVVVGILAPLFGYILERVIMRNLSEATEATKLAVTIGLLIALQGAALWIWNPQTARSFPAFYQGRKVSILGTFVTWSQLITIGVFVACVILLWVLLRRTRIGIDMRAVVDNRSLVMLNGGNPVWASQLSWALGSALAAIAGILIAPTLQLSVAPLTLLVVNAYAAAVIGRLRSLPYTFLGAAIIGLLGSYIVGYLPVSTVGWLQNLPNAVPIIVLFIALLVHPHEQLRGYKIRRTAEAFPLPAYRQAFTGAVVLIGACALLAPFISNQVLYFMSIGLALGIVGLSLVPLLGYGGQISLCQMTFAGVGALTFAHASGGGSPLALVAAFVSAGIVGALVALPAIRLRGLYLALATAAVAELFDSWLFGLPSVTFFGHTLPLFESGTVPISRLSLFGLNLNDNRVYLVALAIFFSLVSIGVVVLRRSWFGRALLANRESPAGAETLGMRTTLLKLAVFSLSAGTAGVGGVFLAQVYTQVNPTQYSFLQSLPLLLLMMAGGVGLVSGSAFGAAALGAFGYLGTLSSTISKVAQLLPGLVGVGLGKQPNGVVADIADGLKKLGRRLPKSVATIVGVPLPAPEPSLERAVMAVPVAPEPDVLGVGGGREGHR